MKSTLALTAAAASSLVGIAQAFPFDPICREVSITVSGQANNYDFAGVTVANVAGYIESVNNGTARRRGVSGTYQIAGRYCEPAIVNQNFNHLQLLSHGITSDRNYWSALGGSLGVPPYQPGNYSWVQFAASQGYPTLAIDRLGAGASSHPDPVLVVQGPFEIALLHNLTTQIKAGTTGQGNVPRPFEVITYVGHSYGSELGNSLVQEYPDDFASVILTGFSESVDPSLPGVSLNLPVPAAFHNPAKFGNLPPGYLAPSSETGHTNSFFGTRPRIDYDPTVAHIFYDTEDTVTLGTFVTVYAGTIIPAPAYTKRVLVLTGENDQAFCGLGSPVLGPADCSRIVPATQSLFPNADYNYYIPPNTGHTVNLHYTAKGSYVVAHRFLAGASFGA